MRKRKDYTRIEEVLSPRLVVIASEGRCTESIYFSEVRKKLTASNVQLEILERDSDDSSPENVYAQIYDFIQEYNIKDDDELWIVIDRDRWQTRMLSYVAQLCAQNKHLHFCMSNPCFELWLILHLEDVSTYDDNMLNDLKRNKKNRAGMTWTKQRMRALLGSYSESKYEAHRLIPFAQTAIDRAKKMDINPQDRWPQTIGTRVYLLMESLTKENR